MATFKQSHLPREDLAEQAQEQIEVACMAMPLCNFEEGLDADAVFEAIVGNAAVPDEVKRNLFFLQSDV